MAYSQIAKPTDHFNTILWTGNGADGRALTGVGFQPDWVWIKDRDDTESHRLTDSVRGATKSLRSNQTNAEATETDGLQSFNSDGFTVGTQGSMNKSNGDTYVGWSWLAGGSASSNSDGAITSTVSANTTAGFSIVKWDANGGNNATVGHGLGAAPKMIIYKARNNTGAWYIWLNNIIDNAQRVLNFDTDAKANIDSSTYGTPSSTAFSNFGFGATEEMIAYCFAEKKGYSKISSFVGNGSSDGTFVYLGFRPSFILYKVSSASSDWYLQDNKRLTFNVNNTRLEANNSDAEVTGAADSIDMLSNGFKMRHTSSSFNNNGATYIYYAVAENPFVGNDSGTAVPVTAG